MRRGASAPAIIGVLVGVGVDGAVGVLVVGGVSVGAEMLVGVSVASLFGSGCWSESQSRSR